MTIRRLERGGDRRGRAEASEAITVTITNAAGMVASSVVLSAHQMGCSVRGRRRHEMLSVLHQHLLLFVFIFRIHSLVFFKF